MWQLGKLSPGEDRTVEMQLMPTPKARSAASPTVTYAAQASCQDALHDAAAGDSHDGAAAK